MDPKNFRLPAKGYRSPLSAPSWRSQTFYLEGSDIDSISYDRGSYGEDRLSFEVRGEGAQRLFDQMNGLAPVVPPAPEVNHQDEALAAARRDRDAAVARARAAEAVKAALEGELEDYQGEIETLQARIDEMSRSIVSFDPGGWNLPPVTAKRGGINYIKADIEATRAMFEATMIHDREALEKEIDIYLDPFTNGDTA